MPRVLVHEALAQHLVVPISQLVLLLVELGVQVAHRSDFTRVKGDSGPSGRLSRHSRRL